MNKGLKLFFCKECKTKRFCNEIRLPGPYFKRTCSKGHSWTVKGFSTAIVHAALKEYIPKLKNLFERDEKFYTRMRIK